MAELRHDGPCVMLKVVNDPVAEPASVCVLQGLWLCGGSRVGERGAERRRMELRQYLHTRGRYRRMFSLDTHEIPMEQRTADVHPSVPRSLDQILVEVDTGFVGNRLLTRGQDTSPRHAKGKDIGPRSPLEEGDVVMLRMVEVDAEVRSGVVANMQGIYPRSRGLGPIDVRSVVHVKVPIGNAFAAFLPSAFHLVGCRRAPIQEGVGRLDAQRLDGRLCRR